MLEVRSVFCLLVILNLAFLPVKAETVQLSRNGGWTIPGLKLITARVVKAASVSRSLEEGVQVLVYDVGSAQLDARSSKLPFLWPVRDQVNAFIFEEVTFAASIIRAYEYMGQRFAFAVEGARFVYDPGSKAGGFAGELRIVLEDRNGDGKFELAHHQPSRDYNPTAPSWVKR